MGVLRLARPELPPGPPGPAVLQSMAMLRLRHSFVPWLQRRYGDAFSVRLVPEGHALVLLNGPERTKEIFAGDPAYFHAGRANAVLRPVMGDHSLLLVDDEEHRRARKLLMPAFRPSALRGYADVVAGIAEAEVGSWPTEREFRSLDRMNALTLEVILRVVFGVADEQRLARLRPLVDAIVATPPVVLVGWGYSWLHRLPPWRTAIRTLRELDALLFAEIAERRSAPDLHERTDVLSRLLFVGDTEGEQPLTDVELRDQLVTLLLAGHETTACALSWALYELGRDPDLLARGQRAADDGDDAFLEAVLKESMRLHPVVPMALRYLTRPATVGGLSLPAGVAVGASILLAHQDPRSFPEPERFRPERFLDGEVAPHTWLPFGGGVRRCIGAGFSLMEGVAVLRAVLRAYDVGVVPGHDDRPRVRNITSVPGRGARIVVRRR